MIGRQLAQGARLALVLALLSTGVAACGSASAAAPGPGCNLYDNLTEKISAFSLNDLAGPYPRVGDSATYLTKLYEGGQQVGTVYGTANIPRRLPGGHLLEYSDERITLFGGVIETEGFYDLTKARAHKWQYLPAIGISGGFQGKLGRRSFQILKAGASLNAKIELCPVK